MVELLPEPMSPHTCIPSYDSSIVHTSRLSHLISARRPSNGCIGGARNKLLTKASSLPIYFIKKFIVFILLCLVDLQVRRRRRARHHRLGPCVLFARGLLRSFFSIRKKRPTVSLLTATWHCASMAAISPVLAPFLSSSIISSRNGINTANLPRKGRS